MANKTYAYLILLSLFDSIILLKNRKDSTPDPNNKTKHNMDPDRGSSKVTEPDLVLEPVIASFGSGS